MTNIDPRPGDPGQLETTGPARMRFPYEVIAGNPDGAPLNNFVSPPRPLSGGGDSVDTAGGPAGVSALEKRRA